MTMGNLPTGLEAFFQMQWQQSNGLLLAVKRPVTQVIGGTVVDDPVGDVNTPGGRTILTIGGGFYGQSTPPPPVASLTWVNQGGATATDGAGIFDLVSPPNEAADSLHCKVQATPATPYTATIGVLVDFFSQGGDAHVGLVLRESATGKLITLELQQAGLQVAKYSSPTSGIVGNYNQIVWNGGNGAMYSPIWLRVVNDGTNLSWYASNSNRTFVPVLALTAGGLSTTEPKNDFFTTGPDEIGVFVCGLNGGAIPNSPAVAIHPFDWASTSP